MTTLAPDRAAAPPVVASPVINPAGEVVQVTESAMRGEIEFQESFRRRVALLRGLPEKRGRGLLDTIPLVQGAEQLIGTLKMLGYKTAILSGGFNFLTMSLPMIWTSRMAW